MCGIAGIFCRLNFNQLAAKATIKKMTDVLGHRGPDAEGYYIDDSIALGHKRLSIIDLSYGQQPMSVNGRWHIVFNGEIYNFKELRDELLDSGHEFYTLSDTEVILCGYQEWGEKCLDKLNGMFAFAIWDSKERSLFLARDRVGKKPLYYHFDGRSFFFASELKALLQIDCFQRHIDPVALDCYFSFGYIPAPLTVFKGVKKLPAAHFLKISTKGMQKKCYWDLKYVEESSNSPEHLHDEFECLFDDAVSIRLMSEVPLGAFLSGGLDSTLVVSSMSKEMNQPVLTNSIGFGIQDHNELPVAKVVAQHFHTDHREFTVQPDIWELLQKISWYFDEPFADSSAVPSWYVCKMARENVTVALSGDGGDEVFGGYTFRYLPHMFESQLRGTIPASLRKMVFGFLGSCYPASPRIPKLLRLKTIMENLGRSNAEAFYHDLIWLRSDMRQKLYLPDFMKSLSGWTPFNLIKPLYDNARASSALNHALYTDVHFYLTDNCLVKVDRMSMAHSLEVRSPLLDYRLMEFAATLPLNLKIQGGKGKKILRDLARKRLPVQVLKMPKKGFSVPAAQWLRSELRELAGDIILAKDSFCSTFLRQEELADMWSAHQSKKRDHHVFLWGVMMLELWARHYM